MNTGAQSAVHGVERYRSRYHCHDSVSDHCTDGGLDEQAIGVFLGVPVHDVAQVVGAGFPVSDATGETATLVKLIRVSMLAPVVLLFALMFRNIESEVGEGEVPAAKPPLIPSFVVAFLIFAGLNSVVISRCGIRIFWEKFRAGHC